MTAEEVNQAHSLANRLVEQNAGRIKQFFLRARMASDIGTANFVTNATKLVDGVYVRYVRNSLQEQLYVTVLANVFLEKMREQKIVLPLLDTKGWEVRSKEGYMDFEANVFYDDPKYLRVNFENSANCGGNNSSTQTVEFEQVLVAIRGDWDVELMDFDGLVELQNSTFEVMTLKYFDYIPDVGLEQRYKNERTIITSESKNYNLQCAMGAPTFSWLEKDPILLKEGKQLAMRARFSTNDGLYHTNAFYELKFRFTPRTPISIE